jgi:RHH-type proline utilization regulon transcriptional repressor/proline dehydrogenase/delta 1-pyrroline-5-carboxylate dehydrogenase
MAGGPDYLLRLVRPRPAGRLPIAASAVASYRHWWAEVYGSGRDASGLRAESNVLRHLPVAQVVVRAAADTPPAQIGLLREAAGLCGTPLELSVPPGGPLAGPGVVEEDSDLARRIGSSGAERLRVLGPLGDELLRACHAHHISVDDTPVTGHGRVELPCWLREQSVSRTLHRHGRVAGP